VTLKCSRLKGANDPFSSPNTPDGMRNVIFDGCNRRSKANLVRSNFISSAESCVYKDTSYLILQDTNPLLSFNQHHEHRNTTVSGSFRTRLDSTYLIYLELPPQPRSRSSIYGIIFHPI
jgi:hypothetical protein